MLLPARPGRERGLEPTRSTLSWAQLSSPFPFPPPDRFSCLPFMPFYKLPTFPLTGELQPRINGWGSKRFLLPNKGLPSQVQQHTS